MRDILRVGTSAGGARAKAVIAYNETTGEVRSGQTRAPDGFTYWILKFDGVSGNRDRELEDPQGYGKVEFAYHRMAVEAGITMTPCRLLHENRRSHFMTRRFDRTDDGEKLFVQSLCALDHLDFNRAGAHGYEQALQVAERLHLPRIELEQLFRRMAFNILARNQDDHTKNISFMMDREGQWVLAPAYDLIYSYNPTGTWTARHQMTLNGKQDDFRILDFETAARRFGLLKGRRLAELLEEVDRALGTWRACAAEAGVPEDWAGEIEAHHRRLADL
jgi:serine/threonine-protein kinase HipA